VPPDSAIVLRKRTISRYIDLETALGRRVPASAGCVCPDRRPSPMRMTHRTLTPSLPFLRGNTLALLGLLLLAFSGPARATSADGGKGPTKGPRGGERAAAPEYGSPRDTLKTLYFAIDVYGQLPGRIDDAVACLGEKPQSREEEQVAARLAIQLEAI